jgi:hypothetical protein
MAKKFLFPTFLILREERIDGTSWCSDWNLGQSSRYSLMIFPSSSRKLLEQFLIYLLIYLLPLPYSPFKFNIHQPYHYFLHSLSYRQCCKVTHKTIIWGKKGLCYCPRLCLSVTITHFEQVDWFFYLFLRIFCHYKLQLTTAPIISCTAIMVVLFTCDYVVAQNTSI